jgi:hypothetical protein
MADDPARPALDTALVGEDYAAIRRWRVAIRRATIDALLPFALQANVMIDDPDVSPAPIDIERVERQLALDRRWVKNCRAFWAVEVKHGMK